LRLRITVEEVFRLPLPSHSRNRSVITAVLLLLAAAHLHAQTQPTPSITINARLVVLDVVVTDAHGHPVDNLTANDLQVFEDGKLQHIRSLEPPSAHTLPAATLAAGPSATFDPAHPAAFGSAPVTILLLDQLNTRFADSSFARRSVKDFLDKQPAVLNQPTTLLSLYDNHLQPLHPFTRDRDALLQALAQAPTKFAWKLELNGNAQYGPIDRLDQSLRALEDLAQSFARIPGHKNLIWIGGGFPTVNPTLLSDPQATEVHDTLQHVTDVLLDTRVTLYAVDPTTSAAGMSEITDESAQAFADAAGDSLSGHLDPFGATDDFDALGPVTGGSVVRGLNDVAAHITSAVKRGSDFYTLAYTPTSSLQTSAKYRTIKVVCLRPGLTVSTRSGYYPSPPQQDTSTTAATYDLSAAAESSIPLTGLAVSVSPTSTPNIFIVHVPSSSLHWTTHDDGTSTASVYILSAAFNAKKKMLAHTVHPMTATARPGTDLSDPSRVADFLFTADPAPKASILRFVVRDSSTGRMGSFDLAPTTH
jgi:VWFA-related protein